MDGQYGPKTAAAVKAWQKAKKLPVTGIVDSVTWAKMKPYMEVSGAPLTGVDISWPQCPKNTGIPSRRGEGKPMPKSSAKFVVVGVTNGIGFHPNPCLPKHVKWIKDHRVYAAPYAFTTYPTSSQLKKYAKAGPYKGTSTTIKLKNAGYAQAKFNVATMKKHAITSPFIWVDVEQSRPPAPWSKSRTNNKAVVDGLCSARSVQGGKIVMGQWWVDDSPTSNSTDYNVLCPGYSTPANLARYFHNY